MPAHATTCQVCGATFYAKPSKHRLYCSRACTAAAKTLDRVERTCLYCGKTFLTLASRIKYGADYCDATCFAEARRVPLADRLWAKVDKDGPVPAHCPERGPCWVWTASCDEHGYGYIGDGEGGLKRAHRAAYELTVGYILPGLDLCHHCDNPACVRPSHMFPGTRTDNIQDAYRKGRKGAHRQQFARGEGCGQAILTQADVREIRALRQRGLTQRAIAARYDCSPATIGDILRGVTWRHVV